MIVSITVSAQFPKNLHDAERKRGFEHSALSVDVQTVAVARNVEKPQVRAVRSVGRPVGAVRIGDASQAVNTTDECANEEKVDEGNEFGRVSCARVQKQGPHCPCCSKY